MTNSLKGLVSLKFTLLLEEIINLCMKTTIVWKSCLRLHCRINAGLTRRAGSSPGRC